MKRFFLNTAVLAALLAAFLAATTLRAAAQAAPTASLAGTIADPTGAVIPGATLSLTTPDGHTVATVTSDATGHYAVHNLAPGLYIVLVGAKGFATSESKAVTLAAGESKTYDVTLRIAVEKQQVVVNENEPTVGISPSQNANSLVLTGKDLNALSNDPDELQQELEALAGPGAGPNGGQIYIDGFSGGQIPPKSAILEIRINRDPFSAQYDKLGYGRIEIITKPGTNQFHGQAFVFGNASQLNTGTPFAKNIPSYYMYMFNGTVSGPISKHASFFFSAQRRSIQENSIITAFRLAGETNGDFANGIFTNAADYDPVPFNDALLSPMTRTSISPRIDVALGAKNSLTIRYRYWNNGEQNQGVGEFSLPEQAYQSGSNENVLQVSDTEVFNPRVINQAHFEIRRSVSSETPSASTPQVGVSGLETFGGSGSQFNNDHSLYYELRNLTGITAGSHSITFGGRLRVTRDANTSGSGFNGSFTFGGHTCASGATNCTSTTAAQSYAATIKGLGTGESWSQILANGGGPSQLTLTYGNPKIVSTMADVGLYYQDDWTARKNLELSYGVRWESQSGIQNQSNWAPRISFAYSLGSSRKQAKTVIRGGYGIFYDRFGLDNQMQADRLNDSANSPLHEAVIENPTCYDPTSVTAADLTNCQQAGSSSSKTAVYELGPHVHAGVNNEAAASLQRQLTKGSTVSVTYVYTLGQHMTVTRNANAPQVPGYNPNAPNLYQYYTEGVYKQNEIIANFNSRFGQKLSLFGFYTASWANSDTSGNPSNSANLKLDYGRAGFNVRNRLFIIGNWSAPWGLSFSPFIAASSGRPFNITLGQDVNGDSFFNDRPSYAQPGDTDTISTPYGDFNLNPGTNYTPIPINLGTGPANFSFNLRMAKSVAFGPKVAHGGFHGGWGGGGGGHHHGGGLGPGGLNGGGGGHGPGPFGGKPQVNRMFNMELSLHAMNLFNDINLAPPIGVLGSPEFGKSNALAGGIYSSGSASRRVYASMVFSF